MRRLGFFVLLAACAPAPAPKPVSKAASSAPVVAAAPPAVAPPPAPRMIPELAIEPFRVKDKPLDHVFSIEGATIVTVDNVAGYIDGDRVEWIAKVPKELPQLGLNRINQVHGKYLDAIDVIYWTEHTRSNSPVWLPLTGKGAVPHEEAPGGTGEILEARVGDGATASVILATYSGNHNYRMTTVRGPKLTRTFIDASVCTENSYYKSRVDRNELAAVKASAIEGTAAGSLVAIGPRCEDYGSAFAEYWAPGATKSKLVDLGAHWKRVPWSATVLRAGPDELWLHASDMEPIVHFKNGEFKPLPPIAAPMTYIFTSTTGQLHVLAGNDIHRWTGGAWEVVARIPEHSYSLWHVVMDAAGGFWMSGFTEDKNEKRHHEVLRLRESKSVPAETTCTYWLAYLGDKRDSASQKEGEALKKVVAGYPKSEGLKLALVDGWFSWNHYGVRFGTKAEADAFIDYARTVLPREHPRTVCLASKTR